MLRNLTGDVVARGAQFLLLACMPLFFIISGLFLQPIDTIIPGIWKLMIEPDFLIADYFVVGGIGSAFINAGLLTLVCIGLAYFLGAEMEGQTIASIYLMFGFALFGKNLMNVWTILAGVFLYSWYHKTSVINYLYIGFYGTALSPIITQIIQSDWLPSGFRVITGVLIGLTIGFVLPPLANHTHYAHKGYSLYNVGFACGIIATVVVSVMKSFGIEVEARTIWYVGGNKPLGIILYLFFLGLMLIGFIFRRKETIQGFCHIFKTPGLGGSDYVKSRGMFACGFNMGLNGIVATTFLLLVGGELNGPTIGGIMSVVGYGAVGKHPRNIFPIMLGVYLSSFVKEWSITDPIPMLALLFCTTLAPVAGEFGVIAGIIAGALHSSVVMNVGGVYAGMNLYNNGFAGGIVAIFLAPILQSIRDRRAKAQGRISL